MSRYKWGCNVQKRTITSPTSKIRKLKKIVQNTNGRIESMSSQKDDTTKVNLIYNNISDLKEFFDKWDKCLNPPKLTLWKRISSFIRR